MKIKCVWEHNGNDSLLYSGNFIGAYTRGVSKEDALKKMEREIISYCAWSGQSVTLPLDIIITQEKMSELNVRDADSDVIFDSERTGLTISEYNRLKELALKSATDFYRLYDSFPDKNKSCLPERDTFYFQEFSSRSFIFEIGMYLTIYHKYAFKLNADISTGRSPFHPVKNPQLQYTKYRYHHILVQCYF